MNFILIGKPVLRSEKKDDSKKQTNPHPLDAKMGEGFGAFYEAMKSIGLFK